MKKKRFISIVISMSILFSMFNGIANAAEPVSYSILAYSPKSFDGYYVFNNKTDIPAVAKAYMGGSYNSKFSINSLIKSVKWNISADADTTQLSTYIGRADRSKGFAICYGGDVVPEILRPAVKKGDVQIAAVMQGYADKHTNIKYHLSSRTTNVDFKLKESYSKVMAEYYSDGQRPAYMGWVSESQRVPIWYDMKTNGYFPLFDFCSLGCACGGVHFNNISIMLKDKAGPVATEIYPSSDEWGSNRRTTYKGGETVYFNVRFNENVKFSDDAPAKDKILKVKKKFIATNTEQSDTIDATYYNLVSGNTMIFKYVVPEGEAFEFYSDSIADWGKQTYLYSDEETYTYTDPVLSQVDSSAIEKNKLNKVKSCIVDIAGNPMEKSGSVTTLTTRAYMDNVKPVVQRVEVLATKGEGNQSGSKTYLKTGDQVIATAVFNEEIGVKLSRPAGLVQRPSGVVEPLVWREMEATLNITRKKYNSEEREPVKVASSTVSTGPDGERSGTIVTKVSFPYTLRDGDLLEGDRINITDLRLVSIDGSEMSHNASGVELTDGRGNPFATTANTVVSAQQYEVDNEPPTVTIENAPAPIYYSDTNPCEFYYKVSVADDKSGILGKMGQFSIDTMYKWENVNQDVQYCISDSPDKPTEYKSGKSGESYSFVELPGGTYIHIKLTGTKATGELRFKVTGFDRNDNATYKDAYANKPLVKLIDTAVPDINATYTVDSSKNYVVNITATDESTVSKISYQWVSSGSAIQSDKWLDEVNATTSSSFNINLNEATVDKSMNEKTLYIKATDEYGNTTSTPSCYTFQLDRLEAGAQIIVTDFDPAVTKAEHDIKAKILDDNTVIHVEWRPILEDGSEGGARAKLSVISANSNIKVGPSNIDIISYPLKLNSGVDTFDIAKANASANFLGYGIDSYNDNLGYFYGKYRVYITAARITKDENQNDMVSSMTVSSYTMKFVGTQTVPNYELSMTPILPDGTPANASLIYDNDYIYNYTGTPYDTAITTNLTSTEGVRVKIDIRNLWSEDIGLDFIDFANSKYELYDGNDNKIYEKKLDATETQYMTIPDEVLTSSSNKYLAKVTLVEKNGKTMVNEAPYNNSNYNNILRNITVDRRKIDAFGPSAVKAGDIETGKTLAKYSIEPGQVADSIYVGKDTTYVEFTCATLRSELKGKAFFKIWLESNKAEDTTWGMISLTSSDVVDQNVYDTYGVYYYFPDTDLPLKVGENHLKYQFMLGNGEKSEVKDLTVYVDESSPQLVLGCDNASSDGSYYRTTQKVTPHIEELFDNMTANEKLMVDIKAETQDADGNYVEIDPVTTGGAIVTDENGDQVLSGAAIVLDQKGYPLYEFTQNGIYTVTVTDQAGNTTQQQINIDWLDYDKPTLSVSNAAISTDFNVELNISDGSNDAVAANAKNKFSVLMQFDKQYSALAAINAIGENGEAKWIDITDSAKADFPGKVGITSSVDPDGKTTYFVSGEFQYDKDQPETSSFNRTIRFKVVDAAGNESEIKEVTINKANAKPTIVSHGLEQGKYAINFNTTVKLDSACKEPNKLSRQHTNLSIYENGTHKINFRDLFGNTYEETITADIFEKAYQHGIAVSETLPTKNDVVVELNTAITDGLYILDDIAIKDDTGAVSTDATVVKTTSDVTGAGIVCTAVKITLKSNAFITYTLRSTQTGATKEITLPVLNIDKVIPTAHIVYDYEAPIINGETAGYVTAFVVSDNEEIRVTNGTGQSHLFTAGQGESYTFEFFDLAGNKNSIVARVDAAINKTYFANDTTAPKYSFELSSMNGKGINKFYDMTQAEYEQSMADSNFRLPYISGKLVIDFDITDINKVNLSLKVPNTNVTVYGNKVVVSDNTQFTVVLKDANNNVTEVPFNINTIDNQAPTGTVKYEVLPDKSVRAYLTMNDNISEVNKLSILNTSGVEYDAQKGYYITFIDNGSSSFLISDEAGNESFIPASVAFIDKIPPNIKSIEWTPFKYTLDNKPLKEQLSDKKFNGNVTAFLIFSKPIKAAELLTTSEKTKIDLAIATMSVLVTFKENTSPSSIEIKVTDYSDNTKVVGLPPVDIIDKKGPVVLSVTDNPSDTNKKYKEVEYTFNLDENAFFTSEIFVPTTPGELPQAKNKFTKKITQNGSYNLSFTDEAGNVTNYTLNVKDRIDTTPPSITLYDVPATKEMIAEYNKIATTAAIHMMTNQSVAFEVSMSKKGVLSVNLTEYKVDANEKIQVVAPYNGIYNINAEDEVGFNTASVVNIDCIDKVLPTISVPSLQTMEVLKGTDLSTFTKSALKNVTAKDNNDGDLTAKVTLNNVTQVDLSTPGNFSFNYSVTDSAGNIKEVARYVKVYTDAGFTVFVNSKLAEKGNLILATPNQVASEDWLDITTTLNSNLPVKMYYKKGIQTEGTMKNGATAFTGGFNVKKGNYYTIYIQTQDRASYLTYVYVTE